MSASAASLVPPVPPLRHLPAERLKEKEPERMHRRYGAAVQTDAAPVPVENEPQAAGAARRQTRVLLTACWLLLVVLYPSTATAHTSIRRPLTPAHAPPSLRSVAPFTHITIDQGLSDGRVQAIVQDHAG